MLKKSLIQKGMVIVMASILAGCTAKSYTIGQNPKLEDITSVTIKGTGGMEDNSWSYMASKDGENYEMHRVWRDDITNERRDETVSISSYAYEKILYNIDQLEYVKKKDNNAMDAYSESIEIYWNDGPSGSYTLDVDDRQKREIIWVMEEAWDNNAYKNNEAIDVSSLSDLYFSYGPTDIYHGDNAYSLRLGDTPNEIIVGYKESGNEEAEEKIVDEGFLTKLIEIIEKNGVNRWDGFNGSDSYILDGSAFGLEISTKDGKNLSAHGHMTYPDGFFDFNKEIIELFATVFEK